MYLILNQMYSIKKILARLENFRKFVARARNSEFWVSVTFDL